MSLTRWNPWSLSSFFDDDWSVPTVPTASRLVGQGLNIYETDDSLVAEIALPGIPEDKVDVSVDGDVVRVSASDDQTHEEKNKRKYFMSSLAQSYNYSFRLPEGITQSKEPTALLTNGILRLRFAKQEQAAPKKIKVISQDKNNNHKQTSAGKTTGEQKIGASGASA